MDNDQIWNKLLEINTNIDNVNKKLGEHIAASKETNKKIVDHEEKLYGNGKQGLIITVDRLDQSHERQNKVLWAIFIALLPLFFSAIWGFFAKPIMPNQNANHVVVTQPASKTP